MYRFITLVLILSIWGSARTPVAAQEKICGYITDAHKQGAYEGVTVYLHDEYNLALKEDRRTKTNSDGYFEFNNLEPGKYSVNTWTWVEFRGSTYTFVYQSGYANLKTDTSANPLKLPCFYVNLQFDLFIDEAEYNHWAQWHIDSMNSYYEQLGIQRDSISIDHWSTVRWGLNQSVEAKVTETIDSLFTYWGTKYFNRLEK